MFDGRLCTSCCQFGLFAFCLDGGIDHRLGSSNCLFSLDVSHSYRCGIDRLVAISLVRYRALFNRSNSVQSCCGAHGNCLIYCGSPDHHLWRVADASRIWFDRVVCARTCDERNSLVVSLGSPSTFCLDVSSAQTCRSTHSMEDGRTARCGCDRHWGTWICAA